MGKKGISNIVHGQVYDSLNYLIVEHSGIAPRSFIEDLFRVFYLNILYLGIDGPCLLSDKETLNLLKGFHKKGVSACVKEGFVWIDFEDVPKLIEKDLLICEGNALLLKKTPPSKEFIIQRLPELSGFSKDKISSSDAELLDEVLCDNDIYLHDDFLDCFIVTKSKEIFNLILEKVKEMSG